MTGNVVCLHTKLPVLLFRFLKSGSGVNLRQNLGNRLTNDLVWSVS